VIAEGRRSGEQADAPRKRSLRMGNAHVGLGIKPFGAEGGIYP
jgi:hypothetical protein